MSQESISLGFFRIAIGALYLLLLTSSISLEGATKETAQGPGPLVTQNQEPKQATTPDFERPLKRDSSYVLVPLSDIKFSPSGEAEDSWSRELVRSVFRLLGDWAWPIVALVVALLVLTDPLIRSWASRIFNRVKGIKVAGLEIELTAGASATLDDLKELVSQVPKTHSEWVSNSRLDTRFVQVIRKLETKLEKSPFSFSKERFGKFRFTLHVQDMILKNCLRQLVDYVGNGKGGRGRLFSARLGIIGKAWRKQNKEHVHQRYSVEEMIEQWGMTEREAREVSANKGLFIAIVIKDDFGTPLAVLYADAESDSSFNEVLFESFEKVVLETCRECGLTDSLKEFEKATQKVGQIDIYETKSS